jgi:hypothetical protein
MSNPNFLSFGFIVGTGPTYTRGIFMQNLCKILLQDSTPMVNGISYDWATAANVSTVIAAIIVSVAVILALWQITESRNTRFLEGTTSVFATFNRKDFRELRRFVYCDLPSDPESITGEQLVKAEEVWVTFNELASMLQNNFLHKNLIMQMYSDTIVRSWLKLAPHISKARRDRNDPGYMEPFRLMYEEARNYRKKKGYPEPKYFKPPEDKT